jgi:hypothetical protein
MNAESKLSMHIPTRQGLLVSSFHEKLHNN